MCIFSSTLECYNTKSNKIVLIPTNKKVLFFSFLFIFKTIDYLQNDKAFIDNLNTPGVILWFEVRESYLLLCGIVSCLLRVVAQGQIEYE